MSTIVCTKCTGKETIRDYYYKDCRGCKGHGYLPSGQECAWCDGSGYGDKKIYYDRECPRCKGLGMITKTGIDVITEQVDHVKQPDIPINTSQKHGDSTENKRSNFEENINKAREYKEPTPRKWDILYGYEDPKRR